MQNTKTVQRRRERIKAHRETHPGHKALYELFMPPARTRTPSKFVTDRHGNRILRPAAIDPRIEVTDPANNTETENGE